jgi:Diphthamide synthase
LLDPLHADSTSVERGLVAAVPDSNYANQAIAGGVEAMAFGDLFLEDIRAYREQKLAGTGIAPLFPLWGRNTAALAEEMIVGGLEAHLTSVDPKKLPAHFAGRAFDRALLAEQAGGRRPMWGERRVPYLRVGGADVCASN